MKITLTRIEIRNFKGIRELVLDDIDQTTDLGGDNGTGKTTFLDAYLWCLFGKDSTGRTDFQLKTLTAENEPIHHLEHSVILTFDVDGRETVLRREYREKWVKKRGNAEAEFTGHEQSFFWNDVPMKAGEYAARVAELIEEETFKLLSNPHYFNGLPWKRRRDILFSLDGGIITDADIAAGNPASQELLQQSAGKTFEEYKKEIAVKKKKIKEEIEHIPAKIEEVDRMRPVAKDWQLLRSQLAAEQAALQAVEAQQADEGKQVQAWAKDRKAVQEKYYNLDNQASAIAMRIENELRAEHRDRSKDVNEWRQDLTRLSNKKLNLITEFTGLGETIESAEKRRQELRDEWVKVNSSEIAIDPSEHHCPTCHQQLPEADREERTKQLTENFNREKHRQLGEINNSGLRAKGSCEFAEKRRQEITAELADLDAQHLELDAKIKDFEAKEHNQVSIPDLINIRLTANLQYQDLLKQKEAAKAELDAMQEFKPDPGLAEKKMAIQAEIDRIKKELTDEEQIKRCDARIDELKAQQKTQAQELARLEGIEFTMLEFMKAKVSRIEDSINRHFKLVRFKMFQTNINGGEEECCDTLIDGVPWQDANNAGRINGGLDIIRALSNFYDLQAPVVIDNAESVNHLYTFGTQVIRLSVTNDMELTRYDGDGAYTPVGATLRHLVEDKAIA